MPESEKLTAIVLAGGMGTRLATRVPDRPKVLAEVNGEPFIVKLLRQLVLAKIKQVVVCTGHRANEVEAAISDHFDVALHSWRKSISGGDINRELG